MKIVKFKGGMGNQMFQYAFLRNLQEVQKWDDVKADFSYFEQCGGDQIRIPRIAKMNAVFENATKEEIKKACLLPHRGQPISAKYRALIGIEAKLNRKYFFEKDRAYRAAEDLKDYVYYDGYWQSWRHLEPIKDKLRIEFMPKEPLSEKSNEYIGRFSTCNSVFVGIRRGDYLSSDKTIAHYGAFDMEYYRNAIEIMKEKIENPVFVFFSNDIAWVKENMNSGTLGLGDEQIIYREDEDVVDDFEELYVMSSCRNAIITNSTFNFWGAWLIDNPNKVIIAPKYWFKDGKPIDIVPDYWIRL